jgi:hypothetical protein
MNKNEVKGKHFTSDPNGNNVTIRYKKKQSDKWKKNLEKYEEKLKKGEK